MSVVAIVGTGWAVLIVGILALGARAAQRPAPLTIETLLARQMLAEKARADREDVETADPALSRQQTSRRRGFSPHLPGVS